jgi:peptidoglycan hydrolase CwlO-like protein
MIQKRHTFYGICGTILGVICGIAGTAFSLGADSQATLNSIVKNDSAITDLKTADIKHETSVQREMDRYVVVITAQMTGIQECISNLTETVGKLRTDVQVLKAIIERVEQNIQNRSDHD